MAEWADVAGCYRWLHDRAEKIYTGSNMWITIPVIVLSTLTGTANFAVGSFVPEDNQELKKYVGAAIGGISIFAGILTTLGNFFQYAQKSEAHKVAGVAWGKFQRQVAVELAINPDERIDAMDFLKICRQDLDRLIEQSPPIPDAVIAAFEKEFKDIPNLKVPDICHGIEHTRVYDSSKSRLGKVAAEAALHLKYKKNALANSILPNIDKKIEEELCAIDGAEYTKLCGMFALAIPTDLIHRLLVCVAQLVNCSATHQSLSEVLCDRGWPRRLAKVRSSQ
jgi:hypothetical protein